MRYALILLLFSFTQCSTRIQSGNTLFRANLAPAVGAGSDTIDELLVNDSFDGQVSIQSDRVFITPSAGVTPRTTTVSSSPVRTGIPLDGLRPTTANTYYFGKESLSPSTAAAFRYRETSIAVQALTIALKVRSKFTHNGTNYPYQVESGSSYGIGAAYKISWNKFSTSKNIWQSNLSTFSITTGSFLALGTAGVKKAANAPDLVGMDFTGLTLSPGLFFQLGYNNINLGYAWGADQLFGSSKKYWLYNGKAWSGIIVSINLAKF